MKSHLDMMSETAPWEVKPTDHLSDLDDLQLEPIPIEQIDPHPAGVVHHLQLQAIISLVLSEIPDVLGVVLRVDFNDAQEALPHEVEMTEAIELGRDHPCVDIPREEMSVTEALH